MSQKISLLSYDEQTPTSSPLEVVKLGSNELPIIPFTPEGEKIEVHYCEEPEINTYAPCNGAGCYLCGIGRKKDVKFLIPVFLPASGEIAVLPVSESLRPLALLPQLINILKAKKPTGVFVSREGAKYKVSAFEIVEDAEAGEAQIKRFKEEYETGGIKLSSVYPTITNEQLKNVEGIAKIMKLKGISL